MEKITKKWYWVSLLVCCVFGLSALPILAQSDQGPPRRIVVFDKTFVNEAAQEALLGDFGAVAVKPLVLINGMAVYLPPQAEKALQNRSEVLRVDDDLVITAHVKPAKPDKPDKPDPTPPPAQELPWGIDRINADADGVWVTTTGFGVRVAILDTGIDLDHLDLQNNIKGNVNFINPRKSANDDNGHGTHVAGIIAAIDNKIGVIGVGPEISLYALKVLDRKGNGWLSDLIEAIQWCIDNDMEVINMSLGASVDNPSFHDAIAGAYDAGIIQVASAGNNGEFGGAISYPAKYLETIAVSAVDEHDEFAYFSSYGDEIDLTAPGVAINSTYNDGGYKSFDGTSMAAPHVTGVAALVIVLQTEGSLSPDEMKTHLMDTSEDLELEDYQQGAGLVRADLAIE